MAAAIAAAEGDLYKVALPDEVYAAATELVFPDDILVQSNWFKGTPDFIQKARLKKLTINDPKTVLPGRYFQDLRVDEIEIPYGTLLFSNQLFHRSRAKKVRITPGSGDPGGGYGSEMFGDCKNLQEVVFEEGVEFVSDGMFYNCTALKSVRLPSTMRSIWKRAFAYCESLDDITLPEGMHDIGDGAFANCKSIKEIDLGRVMFIYEEAFSNSGLEKVSVPETVRSVGDYAFAQCGHLEKAAIHGETGWHMFTDCACLTDVYLDKAMDDREARSFLDEIGLDPDDFDENRVHVWRPGRPMDDFARALFKTSARVERGAGGGIVAKFNDGIRASEIDALTQAISGLGDGATVEMAGAGGMPLDSVSDLSEVKTVIVRFPESK